jgi:hypothetical protein
MVSIWAALVASVAMLVFAMLLDRIDRGQSRASTRVLMGLAPGIMGAFIVGTVATDLVPDSVEQTATPWVVVIATAGVIGLAIMNLARR